MATEKKITLLLGTMAVVSSLFLGISALSYHQAAAATETAVEAMKDANNAEQCAEDAIATLATHVAESKVASESLRREVAEIKTDVKEQRADVRQLLVDVGQLGSE